MLSLLISTLLFPCLVNSQYRFDCDENSCIKKGSDCPTMDCENGRIIKNATACGCCDICLKNLKEDDDCTTTYYGWSDKIAECGPGLICNKMEGNKGKCVPTKCLKKLRKYEKEYDTKHSLNPSFRCDHFGDFEPVVCIDGVLCFCVDKYGTRIFGTDFATNNDTMKCDCSRDIQDFPNEVDADKLPRCLANGNYDSLQCTQEKCFCMESTYYPEDDVANDIAAIKKLPCYNGDRHENNRKTKCFKERERQMKLFKRENLTVIGVDRIQCELDGSYSPLQCKKGRCFCVSRNGKVHKGYENIKKEDSPMICRCLRDKEIMQNAENGKHSHVNDFLKINCDGKYTSDINIISESFFDDFMK